MRRRRQSRGRRSTPPSAPRAPPSSSRASHPTRPAGIHRSPKHARGRPRDVRSCFVSRHPPRRRRRGISRRIGALPDRFVALLYTGTAAPRTVLGAPTRDGLSVAPDPSRPAGDQIQITNDDLVARRRSGVARRLRPKAVDVGMGIKIAADRLRRRRRLRSAASCSGCARGATRRLAQRRLAR